MKWYHDKRAGLVKEEGREGYICRGFRKEHGELLAAAPELAEALESVKYFLEELRQHGIDKWSGEDKVLQALAKAGKGAG